MLIINLIFLFKYIVYYMLEYDIIIVGCARNIDKYLNNTLNKLNMLKSLFKSTKIIIYENDSTDNTLNILKDWENKNIIKLITEKNVKGLRTQRLAHGRTILYNEAMKYTFDLLIILDLDDVINELTEKGIASCFDIKEDWAMLGGNNYGDYYDLWALRTYDDWMPFDWAECVNIKKLSYTFCRNNRYKNIPETSPPIKVKSCFGGIAIYKKKYLNNCSYGTGLFTNEKGETYEVCEHVMFNSCILNNGGNIYINPKMINYNNSDLIEKFINDNDFQLGIKIFILFIIISIIVSLFI